MGIEKVMEPRFFLKWQKYLPFLLLSILLFLSLNPKVVIANNDPKDRTITTQIESTLYEWWLAYWSNNSVACDFFIEHEGNPTDQEIQEKCSTPLHDSWSSFLVLEG
jgi:hypothetical protein